MKRTIEVAEVPAHGIEPDPAVSIPVLSGLVREALEGPKPPKPPAPQTTGRPGARPYDLD